MNYTFSIAADRPLTDQVMAAAETIASSTIFLSNGTPFYYGNHAFARSAVNHFTADKLAAIAVDAEPKIAIALNIIDTYRHYMATDDKDSVHTLHALAMEFKTHGALAKWEPFRLGNHGLRAMPA